VTLPSEPQVLADLPLAIDPAEVLRFQGYKQGRDVPGPEVRALFDEALAEGRRLMAPRAVARWMPVTDQHADALDVGGQTLAIPGIGARWGTVAHVAAVVCTIGDALERRVSALWEARELPLASMLDSVGSGAVESLAEYVNDWLCQQGLPGLPVTNRISPGYGDWDVAEQRRLFALCPAEAIGVTLNAACVMTPGKSISLLVGAGPVARVDHYFSQCARCWMRDCAYRRVPAQGSVRRG
jgi:Vitamin B12 dependent methionine synthase, activation domain